MWYDALMKSEVLRGCFSKATHSVERVATLALSTRTPWAVRNLFRVRDRGRLQLLLLRRLVAVALLRRGATGPLAELIKSPDPYVKKLALRGIVLDYLLVVYLQRAEYPLLHVKDVEEPRASATPIATLSRLVIAFLATLIYSLVVGTSLYYRSRERFFYPPPEPLVLIPTIQPNAPSA